MEQARSAIRDLDMRFSPAVMQGHQGNGIGSAMLDRVEQQLVQDQSDGDDFMRRDRDRLGQGNAQFRMLVGADRGARQLGDFEQQRL